MKKILTTLVALTLCASSHALLIERIELPKQGNPTAEATKIAAADITGIGTDPLTYLAKWEGSLTGTYSSNFSISDYIESTPATALVKWDLTGTGFLLEAVAVKTAQTMLIYSVADDQELKDLIGQTVHAPENKDSISHITFFGRRGKVSVPDSGSTLALLGVALLGAIGLCRFKK